MAQFLRLQYFAMRQPHYLRACLTGAASVLGLLFSPQRLPASERVVPAYAERIWGMQDGLPEQVVQAFAQTKDRYLWIGTTGGLLRFDGASFVLYNRENTWPSPTTTFSA